MNPWGFMFLAFIVCTATMVFGYIVGRDNAERDAAATIANLRVRNRQLTRDVDAAREDAAHARRMAVQVRRGGVS